MSVRHSANRRNKSGSVLFAAVSLALACLPASPALPAQQDRGAEVVANLSTGRVVFCVARDAIIVAAVQGGGEPGSRPPAIVPVTAGHIGVLLGAVEWSSPGAAAKPTRLDAELPAAAANAMRRPAQKQIDQTSEIEQIGVAMLDQLRPLIEQIHHKLDLAPDEPIFELLLADYVENYGPEIWDLRYRVRQENLGNDFWSSRLLRPAYLQLYPPEKGQPRTFVELDYPRELPPLRLAEKLSANDPQLEQIAGASREISAATALVVAGTSPKADPVAVQNFLRGALPAMSGEQTITMAMLDIRRGFQWVLAPQEPVPPAKTQPTEPEAPSLRRRGPRPQ